MAVTRDGACRDEIGGILWVLRVSTLWVLLLNAHQTRVAAQPPSLRDPASSKTSCPPARPAAMTELYSDHSTPYAAGRNDGPNLNNHTYPINNDIPYPAQNNGGNHILPPSSTSSNTPSSPESNSPVHTTPKTESATSPASAAARQEGKQQATFLTKLYA